MYPKNIIRSVNLVRDFKQACAWMGKRWPNVPKEKMRGFVQIQNNLDAHFQGLIKKEREIVQRLVSQHQDPCP